MVADVEGARSDALIITIWIRTLARIAVRFWVECMKFITLIFVQRFDMTSEKLYTIYTYSLN